MKGIDLNWDDSEVLPDKITPDVAYLFNRMSRATIDMIDPRPAENILDVGCGRAIDIVNMSSSGATLIGVEPSFVMLSHARETLKLNGCNTFILQAIGENIPVRPGSIDKVVCKGALDHFADPDRALQQMALAIKPAGKVIIAIANFGSLGFKLGEFIYWVRKILNIRNPYVRLPWEPPPDHTMKFDYKLLTAMASKYMIVEKVIGVSLLCCMPGWGTGLAKLPKQMSDRLLAASDRIAQLLPRVSDVIILRCSSR
jgi:SAM-dependent methyltransferase